MENLSSNTETENEQVQSQAVEVSDQSTPNETPDNIAEVDTNQTVNNLDDAKKVLEATKVAQSKKASQKPSQATVDYKKQYEELQKLTGSHSKELGELRKFYKENQSTIDSYKQFLAQQEEQEMLAKYQSDPTAVVRELARREAASQIAPYQEQISQAQATTINADIQKTLGADYEIYAPVMAEMLDQFLEMDSQNGSKYATELAQNPQILMQLAAGRIALQNRSQNAQQAQVAQQQKAQNLKLAQGVGKGSKVVSSAPQDFANLSLDDMSAQMRQMGIIK